MPTIKDDFDRIERALKAARKAVTTKHWGGQQLRDDCAWSLDALQRLRAAWTERPAQVAMWDGGGDE